MLVNWARGQSNMGKLVLSQDIDPPVNSNVFLHYEDTHPSRGAGHKYLCPISFGAAVLFNSCRCYVCSLLIGDLTRPHPHQRVDYQR